MFLVAVRLGDQPDASATVCAEHAVTYFQADDEVLHHVDDGGASCCWHTSPRQVRPDRPAVSRTALARSFVIFVARLDHARRTAAATAEQPNTEPTSN